MVRSLLLLSLLAQAPQGRATYSSRADLVVLHVSVAERHEGFVPGLPREAFTVFEDGRPQPIVLFEHDDTPVTVGLLIDSSGSILPRMNAVIDAGMAFAESSNPDDELFTLNFNERVWPGLNADREFTRDRGELRLALERAVARGETALFDAIAERLARLERGHEPRKVLVVVSDGGDNASRSKFAEVLDQALRADVVIYTIGIYDQNDRDANPAVLRKLSDVTGVEAFFPREGVESIAILQPIAADLRS